MDDVSSPTVSSERPATVTEAFARDSAGAGSQPATPEAAAAPVETSPAAIVPAAAEQAPAGSTSSEAPGPIPLDRHKAILDGAYKERDAYKAQLDSWKDYEWVRGMPKAEFQDAITKVQRAATDPVGFFRELVTDLDAHPTHAQQLRSEAARLLGRGKGAAEPDLSPDVQITDANGQVVGQTFSAERVQMLLQRAVQEALAKEVGPIKSDYEQRRQQTEAQEAEARLTKQVDQLEASLKKIVGDDPKALEALGTALMDPANAGVDPRDVAIDIFNTHVRQTVQRDAKAEELDSLKRKAAASGLNPAGAVVAQKQRPRSLTDPGLRW